MQGRVYQHDKNEAAQQQHVARRLHDTVLQRLFAVQLHLDAVTAHELPQHLAAIVAGQVDELQALSHLVRTTTFPAADPPTPTES